MSGEKVLTLRGKKTVWAPGGGTGPIDPKRLPEGVPYAQEVYDEWGEVTVEAVGGKESETFQPVPFYDKNGNVRFFEHGKRYRCVFDGVEYILTGVKQNMLTAYVRHGDFSYYTGGEQNTALDSKSRVILYNTTAGKHTFSVAEIVENVQKIDPKCIPEGYPHKESVTIEWDGNSEGREHYSAIGLDFYWISGEILTDGEIKSGTAISSDGGTSEMASYWDQFVSNGYVTEGATLTTSMAVIRKAYAVVAGVEFKTPGIYFVSSGDTFITSFANEITNPMAEEFLPELTSPNGTKYKLTVADDGTLSAVTV